MKKALLVSVCTTALSLTATQAFSGETGPGCGVGSMAWEGQSGLLANISAGTTNGTFLNSFAISSGTTGCDASHQVQRSDDKEVFVASNMDSLSQDIAQGQGDHLSTLATIIGVEKEDQNTFAASMQNEFSTLFSSGSTSTTDVLAAIDDIMLKDVSLAKYVR